MRIFYLHLFLLTMIASQLLCNDFSKVAAGMTKQELIHTLGPGKANAECMGDEYLFYIDRWVWLPNGIVKGYILLDNWKGPCASGTYSSQYGKFKSRAADRVTFSNVHSGMTKQEILTVLGRESASAECMGDEYLFYIDRWVWIPNGLTKGYILLDNWKGPCASGTYSSQYGKFKSRAADRVTFSNVHSGMTKQELIHTLGPGKANAECMGDEYLFYIDRWVWLPNGIVKGYILLDNWKGPCASGTYSSQYGKF